MKVVVYTVVPIFLGLLCIHTDAHNILLLPTPEASHMRYVAEFGKGLIAKHHKVYMLLTETFPYEKILQQARVMGIEIIHYKHSEPDYWMMPEEVLEESVRNLITMDPVTHFRTYAKTEPLPTCRNLLADEETAKKIKSMNFKLAIVDGFVWNRCMYPFLYKVDVPYVTVQPFYEPWLSRSPELPSFVPFGFSSFTEKMTFKERLMNFYYFIDWFAWPRLATEDDELVHKYVPEKPFVSIYELVRRSQLWFINNDVLIDYAKPALPHVINVGGIFASDPKPLPKDLEDFVSSAKHGVIVVSFGTIMDLFSDELTKTMLEAFKKMPYHIIWKYTGPAIKDLPDHILTREWIPQNDLLGHKNTKLFITHCGNNGQFEALYHAVPMVMIPIFGDQKYNAARARYHTFGEVLDFNTMTSSDLLETVSGVIENEKYATAIRHASKIYRSRHQKPLERAVYWLEHILEFGNEHLMSVGVTMPWYQYWMLDLFSVIIAAVVMVTFVIFAFISILCRLCWPSSHKVKSE